MKDTNAMDKKKIFIINTIYFLLIGGIAFLGIRYLAPVLLPFLLAYLIALPLQKVSNIIAKRSGISKKWVAVVLAAAFFILTGVGIIFLGSRIGSWCSIMIPKLPVLYNEKIQPWLNHYVEHAGNNTNDVVSTVIRFVQEQIQNVSENVSIYLSDFSGKAITWVSGFASKVPGIVVKVVITIVATFFITIDFEKIKDFIFQVLPKNPAFYLQRIYSQTIYVVRAYVKSYLLLMAITFAELSVGFFLMRLQYFSLIGLGIAIFDVLPVLGTGGILIPWAVIAFWIGNYTMGIEVLVLYLIVLIVRNILEPKIVGKQIGLHPLVTLIALFVGMKLFGLIGLIGLPVALSIGVNMYQQKVADQMNTNKKSTD